MIKSFIILVLTLVLAAGAFVSRPAPADFAPFIKSRLETGGGVLDKFAADLRTERYVKECAIKDRYFWVTVEKDGKPIYTGAFSRWWGPTQPPK